MNVVPPFAVSGRQLISRQGEYFAGMRQERPGVPATNPVRLGIYRAGADGAETLVRSFQLLLVQQIGESDAEATQRLLTAEGEKLIVFDRVVRQLTLQAVLFDTPQDRVVDGATIPGRGHRAWREFYERARVSRIARSGEIVKLESDDATWRGAFVTQVISRQAGDPRRVDLSATFLVVETDFGAAPRKIPALDVYGRLTAEGAASTGLAAALVVDAAAPTLPSDGTVVGAALAGSVGGMTAHDYPVDEELRA